MVGETLRCPFHGWTYDGSGQVHRDSRTASEHAPPAAAACARGRSYERNRMIFVWHHADGLPPSWDVPLMPRSATRTGPSRAFELEVPGAHAGHGREQLRSGPLPLRARQHADSQADHRVRRGRPLHARDRVTHETDTLMGSFKIRLDRDSWGLGLAAVRMSGIPDAGLLMFSSTSPIDSHNAPRAGCSPSPRTWPTSPARTS